MRRPRLPLLARWVLRLSPVPRQSRAEVHADLHELFVARRSDRGVVHAHWRLYHDLGSLWLQSGEIMQTPTPRSLFAAFRDAGGDLRYAVRLFARQPAIFLLTIIGLSLGLAIATAAFSIMNVALLRGEGIVDPDRAPGVLRTADQSVWDVWQYDEFVHLREGSTRMQVEAVMTDAAVVRTTAEEGDGPLTRVAFVSGGFFAATGGRVTAGRPLASADERDIYLMGQPPVVVSAVFWATRLNRDPQAVGRTIRVGRATATIVGITERGFSAPHNSLLWMPLPAYRAIYSTSRVSGTPETVQVFGRLSPKIALAEAEAQLSAVAATSPRKPTAEGSKIGVALDPHRGLGRVSSTTMIVVAIFVFAIIGLVLLLTSANVATVLVSLAITREREIGVRAALGASRWRIVRQLVTESLALGTIAAVFGFVLAFWSMPVVGMMIEAPAGADLSPDLRVFLFLGLVTIVSGVGAGLAPASHGRGVDLVTPLKGDGAGQNRLAPRRLRSLLVVTQAAVSVLLIVVSTLFVRAAFQVAAIDVGFQPTGLYAASASLASGSDESDAALRSFWARAIAEVREVRGVRAVTLAELAPFGGIMRMAVTHDNPARVIDLNRTRPDYFETVGIRLLTGRIYTREEVAAKAAVAVVSESLARAYWHDQSPLGQMLPQEIPMAGGRPLIIGVVSDTITARLHERRALAVYEPLDPGSEKFARLLIRVMPGSVGAMEEAAQRLRAIDAQADVRITSVAADLRLEASRPRMLATLTGTIGIIAIVLCVIGLYGLTASVVGQRVREMGVRVALGAQRRDLLRLLMWDSLRPVALGLAIGTGAALLASRIIVAAMFFGVSPHDPVALSGAALILSVAATLAVRAPTSRAASVDAASVLKGW